MTSIEEFYRGLGVENEDTIRVLAENSEFVSCKKGDIIFREGDPAKFVYFTLSPEGVTYCYRLDRDGKENVLGFGYGYGHACIGANGIEVLILNTVACLTPTDFLKLDMNALKKALFTDPVVSTIYHKLLMEDRDKDIETHSAFLKYEGRERYLWFLEEHAPAVKYIPQGVVASYLGLKPQSLSRIRRELRKEGIEIPE